MNLKQVHHCLNVIKSVLVIIKVNEQPTVFYMLLFLSWTRVDYSVEPPE